MQNRFLEHLKHDPPDIGPRPWVFFSWSSTVNRGMQTLFSESFEVPAALVGVSRPGGEGRKTAAWLRERGVEVQLLSDADLFDRVGRGEAGRVSLGCDGLDDHRFVNKVGSGALAHLAHDAGTPVEIWTTSLKLLPPSGLSRLDLQHESVVTHGEVEKNVRSPRPLFGIGSLGFVSAVRTEEGLKKPSDIAAWSARLPALQ
jgi:translation initiation factor 2B subunit (eIF-2B alpha/beta/delta family)